MKKICYLFPAVFLVLASYSLAFQLNNVSDVDFIGNYAMDLTLKAGQTTRVNQPEFLINGASYGSLKAEDMISNECVFEAGNNPIDWSSISIPVQYSFDFGCTVAEPRLCCMEMPDEF